MSRPVLYACPHCGWRFDALLAHDNNGLVPRHAYPASPAGGRLCPGSDQGPRNPESDRRPLWKDLPGGRTPTGHEAKGTAEVTRPREVLPPLTPGNWRVRRLPIEDDGGVLVYGYEIFDPSGEQRARYRDPDVMAEHHAMLIGHNDRLKAEVERLNLLLVRKSEALSVFASGALWAIDDDCHDRWHWRGAAEYADPIAFAAREAAAEEPCEEV